MTAGFVLPCLCQMAANNAQHHVLNIHSADTVFPILTVDGVLRVTEAKAMGHAWRAVRTVRMLVFAMLTSQQLIITLQVCKDGHAMII